jgi:hypothetical protein
VSTPFNACSPFWQKSLETTTNALLSTEISDGARHTGLIRGKLTTELGWARRSERI